MANELAQARNLNQYLELPAVQNRLSEKLGLEEAKKFRAALSSAVSTNPTLLTQCEPGSVINAALIGHSLNLPPSPQLGYYYLVPYKKKGQDLKQAQFQIGYKGYIQLAMRSGHYRRLTVVAVKKGEFKRWDPILEELEVDLIEDPGEREQAETVGYCGYFEYINGFRKMVYWTIERMRVHADKYSQAYSLEAHEKLRAGKIPEKDLWKYSSFWYADFDEMAMKTVVRNMLSKWGAMSVDMQRAFEEDLRADGVSFQQAQPAAEAEIASEMGSEPIDVAFEDQTAAEGEPVEAGDGQPSFLED